MIFSKTLNVVIILTIIFFLKISILAQHCGTRIDGFYNANFDKNRSENLLERGNSSLRIPISFFIVQSNIKSQVIKTEGFNEIIEKVNRAFEGANLNFYLCESPNYIQDGNTFNYQSAGDLNERIHISKTVNIYIVDNLDIPIYNDWGISFAAGFSIFPNEFNIGKRYLFLTKGVLNSESVLIHELGHFFGLFHTHEKGFGEELVNGSNCLETGDLICDTPADPNLIIMRRSIASCYYLDTLKDTNGELYIPDVRNYMSYSFDNCRDRFTKEQFSKINYYANEYYDFKEECESVNFKKSYLSPNPAQGHQIKLFLKNKEKRQSLNISVWTVQGQKIDEYVAYKQNEEIFLLLTLENIQKGIYFLSVEYELGNIETFRFYKN